MEAPRPFGFLVSGGAQGQGLFLLLFLLLRHLAAVAHGDGVLIVVFSYHEPVFELDPDTGYRVAINGERAIAEDGYRAAGPGKSIEELFAVGGIVSYPPNKARCASLPFRSV